MERIQPQCNMGRLPPLCNRGGVQWLQQAPAGNPQAGKSYTRIGIST